MKKLLTVGIVVALVVPLLAQSKPPLVPLIDRVKELESRVAKLEEIMAALAAGAAARAGSAGATTQPAAQPKPAAARPKSGSREEQLAELRAKGPTYKSEQVVQHYVQNEVKADEDFKGRWFKVSGRVEKIGKDLLGKPYVLFEAHESHGFRATQCFFKDAAPLGALRAGQDLVVLGVCKGLMMNVLMDECEIVSDEALR